MDLASNSVAHLAILAAAFALYLRLVHRRTAVDFLRSEPYRVGALALLGAALPMALVGAAAGLSLSGALLGLAAGYVVAPSPVGASAIVTFPWFSALCRLACCYRGCCFGRPIGGDVAVTWPAHSPAWQSQLDAGLVAPQSTTSLPVFPSQAGMVAFGVLLGLAVFAGERRRMPMAGLVALAFGTFHLALEWWRVEPPWLGDLGAGIAVDAALMVSGAAITWLELRRSRS